MKTTTTKAERKTTRIYETVKVLRTGSGCVGNMAWETFYVEFLRDNGSTIRWQSDLAESTMWKLALPPEYFAQLDANIRPDGNVQRVYHIESAMPW